MTYFRGAASKNYAHMFPSRRRSKRDRIAEPEHVPEVRRGHCPSCRAEVSAARVAGRWVLAFHGACNGSLRKVKA